MAMDRTHVQQALRLCQTTQGSVLLGGVHRPDGFDDKDESQLPLPKDEEAPTCPGEADKANEMEVYLVWHSGMQRSRVYDLASFL